jgi:hypothetical protein
MGPPRWPTVPSDGACASPKPARFPLCPQPGNCHSRCHGPLGPALRLERTLRAAFKLQPAKSTTVATGLTRQGRSWTSFVGFRRSCPRRSVRTALPPRARESCDTGRAARAGRFVHCCTVIRIYYSVCIKFLYYYYNRNGTRTFFPVILL